ncbi:MAG: hypothetical protein R3343_12935 [Nitriliruptorales bacterium]|nr:hypothetical protein [Nitriliruptorales bacterium]
MQLGRRRELPLPQSLAEGLRAAADHRGHRPAVTVLRDDRREEQGFASLAQWAAKGAHLLEVDFHLGPGERLAVSGPPGWMPAAVCLAAWWIGAEVTSEVPGATSAVLHESWEGDAASEALWFGDAVDGSPTDGQLEPAYPVEVQAFPDQPPIPRARPDLPALATPARRFTQEELIEEAATRWDRDQVLGLDLATDPDPLLWMIAVAARPAVTGLATVVVAGPDRSAADAERVGVWAD